MHQSTQENGGDDIKDDNNIALKHYCKLVCVHGLF